MKADKVSENHDPAVKTPAPAEQTIQQKPAGGKPDHEEVELIQPTRIRGRVEPVGHVTRLRADQAERLVQAGRAKRKR